MSAPTETALAERYAAPAPWRRATLVAVAGVVVLAFLGWLSWATWGQANPVVESELLSFDVVDEHAATAVVQVEVEGDGATASCLLRAYAEDHTVVGELSFAATSATDGRVERTVRTERRATAVESVGCTARGQSRPR